MNRRAFTIMEMVIVMAIIALVFTASFMGMNALNKQKELEKPFEDLRSMAKTAWQRAMTEQRGCQITFYPNHFALEPRQAVNADDRKLFKDSDEKLQRGSGLLSADVPEGVIVEIRKWGQTKWIRPQKGLVTAWVFEQSGLCEPIRVRFTKEDTGGTVGALFDPLTASVKENINDRDGE